MAATATTSVSRRTGDAAARVARVPGLGPRATAISLAILGRLVLANAVAGLFVVTYFTLTDNVDPPNSWASVVVGNGVIYLFMVVVFSVSSVMRGKRLFASTWRWLDEDRAPTEAERADLLGQPMRIGKFPLRYWAAASLLAVGATVITDESVGRSVLVFITTIEGGFVAALLGVLLSGRVLRPVFAEALAGRAPPPRSNHGLGVRLVFAWALGAGTPLVGIIVTPFVTPDAELDPAWPMAFLGVVGLVAGFATIVVTAKAIVQPIGAVRAALGAVEEGDLDTTVVVDDPGELGQLQASVNEMVAGLRQRAELEDLFGRHVGEPVVRYALEQGVQLGGQVRCISVLFVDVTGSTALAQRRPPEEVVALLNRFFAAVLDACDAEDGWIDDYQGDGALCVWGAPVDQPDHATKALRAARALARSLVELRAELPDLDAGIGVSSGDVVAGNVGTERRLEYTVIGSAVNIASRLSSEAKLRPGRLLVDAATVESADADERSRWHAEDPVDLKGLELHLGVCTPA